MLFWYGVGISLVLMLTAFCWMGMVMASKALSRINRLDIKVAEHFQAHTDQYARPTYTKQPDDDEGDGYFAQTSSELWEIKRGEEG